MAAPTVFSSIQSIDADGPSAVNVVDTEGREVARFQHGYGAGLWVDSPAGLTWLSSHEADRLARFIMARPSGVPS